MGSNGMFESMNAQENATPPRNTAVSNTRGNDSTSDDTASVGSIESDSKSIGKNLNKILIVVRFSTKYF